MQGVQHHEGEEGERNQEVECFQLIEEFQSMSGMLIIMSTIKVKWMLP
jgi:hypothetical protein